MKLAALILIGCLSLASSAWAVSWQRPVGGPVLRPFGLSADPYARGQHRGVDLGAPPGTTVRAACGGRVEFAGSVPGGGRTVSVGCGRLVATYQQLGMLAVGRGAVVVPGAAVGTVGRSGDPRDRRSHVHLGAREAATGRYLDPLTLLRAGPRALPPVATSPRRRPVPAVPGRRAPTPRVALRPVAPLPVAMREPGPVRVPFTPAAVRGSGGAGAPATPLVVWIGLAAFGLGLPLGGLLHRRRRARRSAVRGRGWAAAHR